MHTVGGVITAGEAIMEIVPEQDLLVLEGRVATQDIDQVKLGQQAIVRISSFDQRTTPELNGIVKRISADAKQDRDGEQPYYAIRVALSDDEIEKLGDKQLLPGMPVEIFEQTGARTVLNYLIKPLTDQIALAFREE